MLEYILAAGNRCKLYEKSEEVFGLPNIKSAKKRGGNRSEADAAYKVAVKAVDQAAAKGLLHSNNAANKKSAMTLKLNKLA